MNFHRKAVAAAIKDQIDLIVFPELSLSGYHLKDLVWEVAQKPNSAVLNTLKRMSRDIDMVVGIPLEEEAGIFFNTALYFSQGELRHLHRKTQLPNFGMFEEQMVFKAGHSWQTFAIEELTAGILICREMLFPIQAYLYYLQKCDFLICISNSPHRSLGPGGFASLQMWETLGYVYSMFFHQHMIFVNRTGFEDGIGFPGGSYVAEAGQGIVAKAKYFEPDRLDWEFHPAAIRRARIGGNYLRDEHPEDILRELKRILHA